MQRGSDKNNPRQDDRLAADLDGQLGSGGGHREEWADPEPPADDDAPRPDTGVPGPPDRGAQRREIEDERLERARHDLGVANNSGER